MKWHAVVPVKMLSQGKMRLAGVLTPDERRQLVVTMLQDVTRALAGVAAVTRRSVVTSDPSIVPADCTYVEDPGLGLNGALRLVARDEESLQADGLLVLPGDIPFVTADEIADLTAAHRSGVLAIAPDWAETGTNGLALSPANVIDFYFGAQSLGAHTRAAQSAGLAVTSVHRRGLACDIDEPAHLETLLRDGGTRYAFLKRAVRDVK
jgi:2-phospho-L-lactate guanylyltransferase